MKAFQEGKQWKTFVKSVGTEQDLVVNKIINSFNLELTLMVYDKSAVDLFFGRIRGNA